MYLSFPVCQLEAYSICSRDAAHASNFQPVQNTKPILSACAQVKAGAILANHQLKNRLPYRNPHASKSTILRIGSEEVCTKPE